MNIKMVNKYRIIKLAKPISWMGRVYKYSIQIEKKFLWWKWWKTLSQHKTFDLAKTKIITLKLGDANNWQDTVVWSE